MSIIVETGSGTPGANAYCSGTFVTSYLGERGRSTENGWDALTPTQREEKVIAATDYIETRFGSMFRGRRALSLIAGRAATGLLTLPSLPLNTETIVVGVKTYRFVSVLAQENDVLIGVDVDECNANLAAALEYDSDLLGTGYDERTQPNYEAGAIAEADELTAYARTKGESGNLIAFSSTITGATLTGSGYLTGGIDEASQPLSFPRLGLYTREGIQILSVPLRVKQATAEYAVRAALRVLAPDPTRDARMQAVLQSSVQAGPVSVSKTYASAYSVSAAYPAADRLLADFVYPSGNCYR